MPSVCADPIVEDISSEFSTASTGHFTHRGANVHHRPAGHTVPEAPMNGLPWRRIRRRRPHLGTFSVFAAPPLIWASLVFRALMLTTPPLPGAARYGQGRS